MKISTMKSNQKDFLKLAKTAKNITVMVSFILIITVFCAFYFTFKGKSDGQCGGTVPWCGTSDRKFHVYQGDRVKGKGLFIDNCATCHAKDMKQVFIGPALEGISQRWQSEKELYAFIRNSQKMINKKSKKGFCSWKEFEPTRSFPALKDEEIRDILAYIGG